MKRFYAALVLLVFCFTGAITRRLHRMRISLREIPEQ